MKRQLFIPLDLSRTTGLGTDKGQSFMYSMPNNPTIILKPHFFDLLSMENVLK